MPEGSVLLLLQVIIVGDLNMPHSNLDHWSPSQYLRDYSEMLGSEVTWESHPVHLWLNSFLEGSAKQVEHVLNPTDKESAAATHPPPPDPLFVDLFRHHSPERPNVYTCWNQKLYARNSNQGTRIDYIICSRNFLECSKSCDAMGRVLGSDHCPIIAEFACDIEGDSNFSSLPLCADNLPQFTQQMRISQFCHPSPITSQLVKPLPHTTSDTQETGLSTSVEPTTINIAPTETSPPTIEQLQTQSISSKATLPVNTTALSIPGKRTASLHKTNLKEIPKKPRTNKTTTTQKNTLHTYFQAVKSQEKRV
ncbi:Exodeoxyribonuclease III [Pelomyxa schiedti]|nr:Exodeoxyribonuclease III [Pelomyxa schiedti]